MSPEKGTGTVTALQTLLGDSVRRRLVEWALTNERAESTSALARHLRATPRAVQEEVHRLERQGLLRRRRQGRQDEVSVVRDHPAWGALATLATEPPPRTSSKSTARLEAELAKAGAPLASARPAARSRPLEELLVAGVQLARRDATVLRALPVMVLANSDRFDWAKLRSLARSHRMADEVGMVVSLTADLAGQPDLAEKVADLRDRRRSKERPFQERPLGTFEARLARERTPRAAREWRFLLNMDEDALLATLRRHAQT